MQLRQPCTNVCDRARRYKTVYGSRIAPFTEYRCLPFNRLALLYDLRIRNPFPTVSLRVHASYTEAAHDLCISPVFSVNGRLRSCMFDLGKNVEKRLFYELDELTWGTCTINISKQEEPQYSSYIGAQNFVSSSISDKYIISKSDYFEHGSSIINKKDF